MLEDLLLIHADSSHPVLPNPQEKVSFAMVLGRPSSTEMGQLRGVCRRDFIPLLTSLE